MKVWTCLRISASLSSGSGSLLTMCSMKSFGVTAAKFHFNFPNTTSSHSWRESERETGSESREQREITENERLRKIVTQSTTTYLHTVTVCTLLRHCTLLQPELSECASVGPWPRTLVCVEVKHYCYYVSLCLAGPGTEKHQQRHQPR